MIDLDPDSGLYFTKKLSVFKDRLIQGIFNHK